MPDPGQIDACALLEGAPEDAERLAAWLLSLEPIECVAVFPAAVMDAITRVDGVSRSMLNGWTVAMQAQARRLVDDAWSYEQAVRLYGDDALDHRLPQHPRRAGQSRNGAQVREAVLARCFELLRGRESIVVKEHFATRAEYESVRKAVNHDDRLRWIPGSGNPPEPARVVWAAETPLFAAVAAGERDRADTTG